MAIDNLAQNNTEDEEAKHRLQETNEGVATDPAEEFDTPETTEDPHHDDVDVALQVGKETADGKGDDEVPEADFVSYEDPSAEKQERS
jgi:hypothetical protein